MLAISTTFHNFSPSWMLISRKCGKMSKRKSNGAQNISRFKNILASQTYFEEGNEKLNGKMITQTVRHVLLQLSD